MANLQRPKIVKSKIISIDTLQKENEELKLILEKIRVCFKRGFNSDMIEIEKILNEKL